MHRRRLVALLVFGIGVTSCSPETALLHSNTSAASADAEAKLRAFLGAASVLYTTVEAYSVDYPWAATRGHFGLFRNSVSGELIKVACDDSGTATSGPEMQVRDLKARQASRGPLGERLFAATLLPNPPSNYDVLIGYYVPAIPKPMPAWNPAAAPADVDAALAAHAAQTASAGAATRAAVLQALLASGGTVLSAPTDTPYIRAIIPATSLVQFPHSLPQDIRAVELSQSPPVAPTAELFFDSDDMEAKETFLDAGKRASGIRVGLYEGDGCGLWRYVTGGGQVIPQAFKDWTGYHLRSGGPAINGCNTIPEGSPCATGCGNSNGTCRGGFCASEHPTIVASAIGASVDCPGCGQDRFANKADFYYANNGSVPDRIAWFHNNYVNIVNNSEQEHDTNAANYSVRTYYTTLTHTSGNDDPLGLPVHCYANAICVGSGALTSTSYVDHWKTDPQDNADVYRFANGFNYRYRNGIQGRAFDDIEKPDVLAITGTAPVMSAAQGGWKACNESSCAAPKIAGLVALLQELLPITASWPELVRPLIMTSAVSHNVEAAQLSLNSGPDERDGAGIPVASVLKKIVDRSWYSTGGLTPSSFNANGEFTGPVISLQPGEGVRVVFGYLHCVETLIDSNSEFLAIDLDLQLWTNGQLVGWSWSSHNSLEFWEYTNTSGSVQNVQVIIKKYGAWQTCNGYQREYYGLSWAKHQGYIVY